ncbi:protein of unknown function [Prevotella sp. ne3005]|jgi:hypothetical protein|uniref:DUF4348 domain-containing protein n=1 Tax=Prevotella sp. ne3005 TaxID=1761887 RepID=UPI0008D42994|nr:DUF4348 domain-containing protein [Prevotella sp. ne3005]SEN23221.1 protein of unknown function [Prevotella sp. ne3005]
MKRFFIAIAASVLLMFSCTGNRTGQGGEMPEDSVADSTDTVEIDTMELLITQTPMPRAADAMFDDFLFNFLANKRLQKERIVFPLRIFEGNKVEQMEERQWQMEHLFMRQGYYTLLFNDEQQMALMKDTAVSEAIVEKILLAKNQVKDYMFRRIRGAWMLCEVRVNEVDQNVNASFLKFYQKFASDSAFQVKSLNETVQFVGPDPDDDFNMMEGVITADTWEAFAPTLPAKSIYNVIYGKPQEEGNNKIFLLRGVANGLELELRFKRAGDKWLLMKMTT